MPITCSACHHSNDPWRHFCGGCGSGLPGGCKACGAVNRTEDRFCGGCAKALRAIPSVAKPGPPPKKFASTTPIDLTDVLSETPV